jgi:hypothetical protein
MAVAAIVDIRRCPRRSKPDGHLISAGAAPVMGEGSER